MKTFINILVISSGLLLLISSFLFTKNWRVTKKTIVFQYLTLVIFFFSISIGVIFTYPSTTLNVAVFGTAFLVCISIVYKIKYSLFYKAEKKGFYELKIQNIIENFKNKND
jgi:hypothetical protein